MEDQIEFGDGLVINARKHQEPFLWTERYSWKDIEIFLHGQPISKLGEIEKIVKMPEFTLKVLTFKGDTLSRGLKKLLAKTGKFTKEIRGVQLIDAQWK